MKFLLKNEKCKLYFQKCVFMVIFVDFYVILVDFIQPGSGSLIREAKMIRIRNTAKYIKIVLGRLPDGQHVVGEGGGVPGPTHLLTCNHRVYTLDLEKHVI